MMAKTNSSDPFKNQTDSNPAYAANHSDNG
jgi:hypothetical protein